MVLANKRLALALCLFVFSGFLGIYIKERGGESGNPILPVMIPEHERGWIASPFRTELPVDVREGDAILRRYQRSGSPIIYMMVIFSPVETIILPPFAIVVRDSCSQMYPPLKAHQPR